MRSATALRRRGESARQVRNIIPDKMWSSLNLAYFDLRDVEMETIWNNQPGTFYDLTEVPFAPSRASRRARFTLTTAGTFSNWGVSSNGRNSLPR